MNSPISVSDGWWTFTNYGPLTTTFTPAPSCTGSDHLSLGNIDHGYVFINFAVQCTKNLANDDSCWPAATTTQTSFGPAPTGDRWEGIGGYYSPGLYCPSGWETVGVAARDAGSSLTSSGALSTTPVVTVSSSGTSSDDFPTPRWDDPGSVMKSHLEPKQTMAVCCPSSFTADPFGGGCYSIDSSYKPTVGCYSYDGYMYENIENTITYTSGTQIITSVSEGPTSTVYKNETETHTFNSKEASQFTGMVYVAMLTLVHKESDLALVTGSTGSAGATGTAAAKSNAAVRMVGARREGSNGIAGAVGIVMAAMGLGAAIVFQ